MKEKKKAYEAPTVKKVRLDIKASVLGGCQTSQGFIVSPVCENPGSGCPTVPPPGL